MSPSALWTWTYIAWIAGEVVISIATRTRRGQGNIQDRGSQIVLWVVIALSLTACGWMRHLHYAPIPGSGRWLGPASLALMAAGLLLRLAAILTLGRSFSANVATHATQTIQRSGLYHFVRHPSYLGMEMIFFSIGLHARDWICLAVAFIPPTAAVLYRIHVEEAALLSAFGNEYAEYSRTTRRLIPGLY